MKYFKTLSALALAFFVVHCGTAPSENENSNAPDSIGITDTITTPATADTVNAPRTVSEGPDGTITLTAETGKAIGPSIKYMPEWKAFGWFTSSDSVQWDVNVKDAGEYDVIMEWSVDDKEAGKEFVFSASKSKIEGKVGKSGSWETYATKSIGTLKLDAGQQTLTFKSKKEFDKEGGLLDLRSLKLVKK